MDENRLFSNASSVNLAREVPLEDDEEDFCSCCGNEDELSESEELSNDGTEDEDSDTPASDDEDSDTPVSEDEDKDTTASEDEELLDEFSVKMYFKGLSITLPGDSCTGFSGVGVVLERSCNADQIQVQKRLDFYVEESIADYLALIDGLIEAIQNKIRCVFAFTNSEAMYKQVMHGEQLDSSLLSALRERVLEHSNDLEVFVLKYVPGSDVQKASWLAQVAIGVVSFTPEKDISIDLCSICCEEKLSSMSVVMKCSHKFCSHCMKTYVEGKLQSGQIPVKCPQPRCKYCISTTESKLFLSVTSYHTYEKALAEAKPSKENIFCSCPNCSVLLYPHECSSSRSGSCSQPGNSCIECPACQKFFCVDCGVPWHYSLTCEQYQNRPMEEWDAGYLAARLPARSKRWRSCQQCRRMVEHTNGCNYMACSCGHEFCYTCGVDYHYGEQTCECIFWDEDHAEDVDTPNQHLEEWSWDSFDPLTSMMDAYSDQERSQLALIQIAGGFSLTDQDAVCQSPEQCTDSYIDPMKELQQLPWLERFVSVISDNYYEEYMQASLA
ncbi:ubiquitin-protein ligase [Lithospermum erythrorhizon]|uniref:RBR-type E3 ubiquitin transferase n=1 Tax=Lithospermum erythrorhizon TaxID=34254 RepID=A0AAV3P1Y8_LITER